MIQFLSLHEFKAAIADWGMEDNMGQKKEFLGKFLKINNNCYAYHR